MNSRKFTVRGRLQTASGQWEVAVEIEAQGGTVAELRGDLEKKVSGLASVGILPHNRGSAPVAVDPSPQEVSRPHVPSHEPAAPQVFAYDAPPPLCAMHGEPMKISTVQNERGFTHFFCPKKLDASYCKARAKRNEGTGELHIWEVK